MLADLDLARLGLLGDGDADGQNAVVEVGFEVLEIEAVAELDLASERTPVALTEVAPVGFLALPVPFGGDRQDIAFDGDVEAFGFDAG